MSDHDSRWEEGRDDFEQELFEMADPKPSTEPRVARAGEFTGVALPEVGPLGNGVIVTPEHARRLGAQLIRAANEADAILEPQLRLSAALEVLTRTPAIRTFLEAMDPKALAQAERALAERGR